MASYDNSDSDNSVRTRPHVSSELDNRRRKVVVGASVLIVAVAIICAVVFMIIKTSSGFVKEYMVPEENAEYFERYLSPVVMFDPKPFADIKDADENWMVETAIWAALNENESAGTYTVTADSKEIIPTKDITNYYQKYFGKQGVPKFNSFNSNEFDYEFNSKEQSYYIPLIAVTNYVMPKVVEIKHSLNNVTLTVGYISSENWGQDANGNTMAPNPEKYMNIVLEGSKGNFELKSITENTTYKPDNNAQTSSDNASSADQEQEDQEDGNEQDEQEEDEDYVEGEGEDATPDNPIAEEAP